jgi:dihydrofolate synthase/folylpolyglutamate synthase
MLDGFGMFSRKLLAEFLGTFWLVFGGVGSAVISAGFPKLGIGFTGVALAFGLTVLTGAYAFGPVSGGHFNPAVSLGLAAAGRFSWKELIPYWIVQLLGATFAAFVLLLIARGSIDFSLERIRVVLERLGLARPRVPVLTVGGTNGKGSVTALLEAVLGAAGWRVGLYSSPHLSRYEERIRIGGREIDAARLVAVFERVEAARGDLALTYFEYGTAAALAAFAEADAGVLVLEVGMGGRLDAVNAIDADVAVVVSIGLDHCEYLGTTLEAIGREKAGIFRAGRPAIYGSRAMPDSIAAEAARIGARFERLGEDYMAEVGAHDWSWQRGATRIDSLPPPALAGRIQFDNAATALAALAAGGLLPPRAAIAAGLNGVQLAGRFERRPGAVEWIFDVAHNPASAAVLAAALDELPREGRTLLVIGMLADKDAGGVGRALSRALGARDLACAVSLPGERGLEAAALAARLAPLLGRPLAIAASVESGCAWAASAARPGDRVVVCGSFLTVGPARDWHRLYFAAT